MDEKKVMKYYYSFYDVSKDLNEKQFYEFNMAIYKVMFYEEHIERVTFKDVVLTLVWKSVKHSLKSSIDGYCGKKSIDYDSLFSPVVEGVTKGVTKGVEENEAPLTNNVNGNVNGNGNGNGNGNKAPFTFNLEKTKLLSSTSEEYRAKLEEYINNSGKQMSYQDFYDKCEMKPYKYKNFQMAYSSWNKDESPSKAQQQLKKSFEQIRKEEVSNSVDIVLNSGFNPFDQEHYKKQGEGVIDVQLTK